MLCLKCIYRLIYRLVQIRILQFLLVVYVCIPLWLCECVRVLPAGLYTYKVCVGSAAPRQTRWPVLYLLLVTHHVIMAPGNPCNYYRHRVVWSELNIEMQHHGNNSRVCVPHQGPHNVSMSRDKGEPACVMESSVSFYFWYMPHYVLKSPNYHKFTVELFSHSGLHRDI